MPGLSEAHGYLYPLSALDFSAWRNRLDVEPSALCWEQPILRFELRYISKDYSVHSGFTEFVRFERRSRSHAGYLVHVSIRARASRYVAVPGHWRGAESPKGCFVELPSAVTYLGTHLNNDPFSGVWTIVYSEWTTKFGAHDLWEVYDTYRLWFVPPKMRTMIRQLDLSKVLGSRFNYAELLGLLDVIDHVDWSRVTEENRRRGNRRRDYSPGRSGRGGDYIIYDPRIRAEITEAKSEQLMEDHRDMPPGYPTGYVFELPRPVFDVDADRNVHLEDDGRTEEEEAQADEVIAYVNAEAQHGPVQQTKFPGSPSRQAFLPAVPSVFCPTPLQMETVLKFMCDVGVPESNLDGDWQSLVIAMRARLNGNVLE